MIEKFQQLPFETNRMIFPEKSIRLYSMYSQCGHEIKTSDYYWEGLKRGTSELAIWQFTLSGEGALTYEGKEYILKPGQAMLLHIPQDHCYYLPDHSDHWEIVYINLNGRDIMRIWRELVKKIGPVASFDDSSPFLKLAYNVIEMSYNKQINSAYMASSYAYQLMMALANELWPHSFSHKNQPDFIRKVTTYCIDNLDKPITVDDMAEHSGYSRFHFSRLFSKLQGISPAQFLKELRLKQSVSLLQTEHYSIKEIATKCGFDDTSYFCKVFRKNFGHSPGQFRNSRSFSTNNK